LRDADLSEADLFGADLTHADLSGANLQGADVRACRVNEETKLTGVLIDGTTRLDDEIHQPGRNAGTE
jgi:uncharacterized protein YjbI with pentapeptide repeats